MVFVDSFCAMELVLQGMQLSGFQDYAYSVLASFKTAASLGVTSIQGAWLKCLYDGF